ncbi:N-myc protein [Cherax quadricarinatus]|nr:N-myc protein-like isoform X2 [Cherax quadricarinatus]
MLELDPEAEWCQEGPTLSNDIWKKFELLLTPPRSPLRDAEDLSMILSCNMEFNMDPIPSSLELPLMEDDDEIYVDLESIGLMESGLNGVPCAHGLGRGTCTSCTQLALAGSELRHDCMWVGTCTAEAHSHTHYHHPRTHKDSGSQITELLMDSSSEATPDVAAGFTYIADLHAVDDVVNTHDDEEVSLHHQFSTHHTARPDTPSESSETDTDEDNDDDQGSEEYHAYHREETSLTGVHVDHCYHALRVPSPTASLSPSSSNGHYSGSSFPHTPSDSEDEIDVVSVGSPNSVYSSSSNTSSSRRQNNTTFITTTTSGMKKVVKVRGGILPVKPTKRMRKRLQQAVAEGVKRKPAAAPDLVRGNVVVLRRVGISTTTKTPKRILRHVPQKAKALRSDSHDPEKREMHNSLERLRRVDLRNSFEELRLLVPEIQDREKAPKVEILRNASQYCHTITIKEQSLVQEKAKLTQYQKKLRERLQTLQRQRR